MPTYATCAFCGRNDSPRTREHVFADWIAREFPDPNWTLSYPETGQKGYFSKNSFNIVTRKVCTRCNTGWMRKLESETKPILLPLMKARQTTLSLADQLLISQWMIKTVTAYDLAAKRTRDCVFTAEQRRSFMNTLSIPPDTQIFLAQYRGTIGEVIAFERIFFNKAETREHLIDTHGYAATFVIGHVALQVYTMRRGKGLIGKTLHFITQPEWLRVTVPIWPSQKPFPWPPPILLDDNGLRLFAGRWGRAQVSIT